MRKPPQPAFTPIVFWTDAAIRRARAGFSPESGCRPFVYGAKKRKTLSGVKALAGAGARLFFTDGGRTVERMDRPNGSPLALIFVKRANHLTTKH